MRYHGYADDAALPTIDTLTGCLHCAMVRHPPLTCHTLPSSPPVVRPPTHHRPRYYPKKRLRFQHLLPVGKISQSLAAGRASARRTMRQPMPSLTISAPCRSTSASRFCPKVFGPRPKTACTLAESFDARETIKAGDTTVISVRALKALNRSSLPKTICLFSSNHLVELPNRSGRTI